MVEPGRDEVAVGHLVAAIDEVLDCMTPGLAAAAGEEDAHGVDRIDRIDRIERIGRSATTVTIGP